MVYPKNILIKETHITVIVKKRQDLFQKNLIQLEIKTTFQSRFGPQKWLEPYTDKTI